MQNVKVHMAMNVNILIVQFYHNNFFLDFLINKIIQKVPKTLFHLKKKSTLNAIKTT